MKLLIAAPLDAKGRFEGGILQLCTGLSRASQEFAEEGIQSYLFNTCRIPRRSGGGGKLRFENIVNFLRMRTDLVREIKATSVDVVYLHSSKGIALLKDLFALRHAKRATRVKTLLHVHCAGGPEDILTSSRIIQRLGLWLIKRHVDQVVFLSRSTATEMATRGVSRSATIYNFTTLEYDEREIEQKIRRVCNGGAIRLLFLGSLSRRKGILDLLQVARGLDIEFVLHIAGTVIDATEESEIVNHLKSLGSRVVSLGFVEGAEKKRLLLDSDILVLPSYAEGLPIAILEGMDAGCAIISTTVGAIPEVVDNSNGFLHEPGDLTRLASSIQELSRNREKLAMLMRGSHDASRLYSLEAFMSQLGDVCRGLES